MEINPDNIFNTGIQFSLDERTVSFGKYKGRDVVVLSAEAMTQFSAKLQMKLRGEYGGLCPEFGRQLLWVFRAKVSEGAKPCQIKTLVNDPLTGVNNDPSKMSSLQKAMSDALNDVITEYRPGGTVVSEMGARVKEVSKKVHPGRGLVDRRKAEIEKEIEKARPKASKPLDEMARKKTGDKAVLTGGVSAAEPQKPLIVQMLEYVEYVDGKEVMGRKKLLDEIKDNREKLSRSVAERGRKLAGDETALENMSIPNRPSTVADEYYLFQGSYWGPLNGKITGLGQPTKSKILSNCLEVCLKGAMREKRVADDTIKKITDTDGDPVVEKVARDFMRLRADEISMEPFIHDIQRSLCSTSNPYSKYWKEYLKLDEAKNYIKHAARIAWKMSLQAPPMTFAVRQKGCDYNKNVHELWYESPKPLKGAGSVVETVVFPALFHGNKLMKKGVVVLRK